MSVLKEMCNNITVQIRRLYNKTFLLPLKVSNRNLLTCPSLCALPTSEKPGLLEMTS